MALDGYLSPEEQRLQKQQKNLKATGKWANVAGTSLSWIPFVGPFLALAGAGIKAGTDIAAGKAQKREALVKEQRAAQLQASPIAPEFPKAQQAAQFAQLGGLGGYEQYRRNIEQSQAQSLNQAMQSATGGEQALVAASNIAAQSSAEQAKLAAQDAQQRAILGQESRAALETIGKQKTDAEIRKIAEQDKLRRAAAAFANAGTGNIMQGISGIADTTAQLGRTIYNTAQNVKAKEKQRIDEEGVDVTRMEPTSINSTTPTNANEPDLTRLPDATAMDKQDLYTKDNSSLTSDDVMELNREMTRLINENNPSYEPYIRSLREKIRQYNLARQ